MKQFTRLFLFILALLAASSSLAGREKLPPWLEEARSSAPMAGEAEADAVILWDSIERTYAGRQRVEAREQRAVLIKARDGRDWAIANIGFVGRDDQVRSFKAWLVYPSGRIETFTHRDAFTVAAEMESLYSEAKQMVLDRSGSVRPGTIFAYEFERKEKTPFLQDLRVFQSRIPVRDSRFVLELPRGWSVRSEAVGPCSVVEEQEGTRWVWKSSNLPAIKVEPNQPSPLSLLTGLRLSVEPTGKDRDRDDYICFQSWNDVARFAAGAQDSALTLTDAMVAKARTLTDGARSETERIRAIAQYAQTVNYLATSMDLNQGGGFKPRKAEEVLEKHWGDCKDMVALTRALLKAVGIESVAVFATVGDDTFVPHDWPSPKLFNHCIVAINMTDPATFPGVVEVPRLGRMLIFDPTQKDVPVGELPGSLAGGRVLVADESVDALLELPAARPEDNTVIREVHVSLDQEGGLVGTIRDEAVGAPADYLRGLVRTSSREDLLEFVRDWIQLRTHTAKVVKIDTQDIPGANRYVWTIEVSAPNFARPLGDALMAFRPVFLSPLEWVPPSKEPRTTDYIVRAWKVEESLWFSLPPRWSVENLPETQDLEASFAQYSLAGEQLDSQVVVRRRFESRNDVIPPARYDELLEGYERINRADKSQIVLRADRGD